MKLQHQWNITTKNNDSCPYMLVLLPHMTSITLFFPIGRVFRHMHHMITHNTCVPGSRKLTSLLLLEAKQEEVAADHRQGAQKLTKATVVSHFAATFLPRLSHLPAYVQETLLEFSKVQNLSFLPTEKAWCRK